MFFVKMLIVSLLSSFFVLGGNNRQVQSFKVLQLKKEKITSVLSRNSGKEEVNIYPRAKSRARDTCS
jgi:hypothetical protein